MNILVNASVIWLLISAAVVCFIRWAYIDMRHVAMSKFATFILCSILFVLITGIIGLFAFTPNQFIDKSVKITASVEGDCTILSAQRFGNIEVYKEKYYTSNNIIKQFNFDSSKVVLKSDYGYSLLLGSCESHEFETLD
jgi:hypothetical protein